MQNSLDTVATFFRNVYLIIKISYFKFIKGRDERPQTTLAHSQQQRSFVCALLLSFVSFPQSSKAQMSFCRSFELCAFFFCFVSISLSVLWLRLELELRPKPKSRLEKSKKSKNINAFILLFYFGLGSFYGFLLCMPTSSKPSFSSIVSLKFSALNITATTQR